MTTVARPAGSVRVVVTVLFVCGFALLALTVVLGFEEPHGMMLLLSGTLIGGALSVVFLHLCFTRLLTSSEKRLWLHLLTGRRAPLAWSEYLTSADLAASATRLSAENSVRSK